MKRPISAIYDMTQEEFDRHLRRNARLSAKAKARRLARIEAEEWNIPDCEICGSRVDVRLSQNANSKGGKDHFAFMCAGCRGRLSSDDSPQLDKLCPEMLWSRRGRG